MRQNTSRGPYSRILARVVAVTVLLGPIGLSGCGGSFGVDDGSVVGTVFGRQTVGTGFNETKPPVPLEGVTVVAVRQGGDPAVIRTTTSDADGKWVIPNLPTGEYLVGFDRRGFEPIDTAMGATNDRTAIGSQVRIFVEAESTALAPDVIMTRLAEEGESTVVVTLVDQITGQPITNATVIIGTEASSEGGSNGVYTLQVPVAGFGQNLPQSAIQVNAEGYGSDEMDISPNTIRLVPNDTVNVTVAVQPLGAFLTGFVEVARFPQLYNLPGIRVTVENLPESFTNGSVTNESGRFQVQVPSSFSGTTRQFNLRFTAPNLKTTVVSNVVAPTAGASRELSSPVVIQPITVDLIGSILDSSGNTPNQGNPNGIPDTVTVRETGQVANVINGQFTVPDVPTVNANVQPVSLTLDVSVFNPMPTGGGVGQQESTEETIMPVTDGTSNPVFQVPLIQTSAGG